MRSPIPSKWSNKSLGHGLISIRIAFFFFNVWHAFCKGTSLFLLKKRSRCWNLDCCEPLFSIFIGFSPEIKEESCGNHPREIVVFFRYGLFCASSDAYTFLELDYQNNHIITNSQTNRSIAIDRKMEASKIYSRGNKEVNNIIHGVRLLLNKSNRFHNSWKKYHAHPLAWCSSCHQFFAHYLPNPGPPSLGRKSCRESDLEGRLFKSFNLTVQARLK